MKGNIAKDYFLGKVPLERRYNCAQSVLKAYSDEYNIDNDLISKFSRFGGGNAPEGRCGAYYAAKFLLENFECPSKLEEFDANFFNSVGSIDCREIRRKGVPCSKCVKTAASLLYSVKHTK